MLMSNEQGSQRAAQVDFTRSGWRQFFKLNRSLGARFLRGFVLRYELAAYLTAHEAAGVELDEGCQEVCYENGVCRPRPPKSSVSSLRRRRRNRRVRQRRRKRKRFRCSDAA